MSAPVDSPWAPLKKQLTTLFDQTSSPLIICDGSPPDDSAKTMWVTCTTQQKHSTVDVSGCQVKILQSRGTGGTWALVDLGLFGAVCVDIATCEAVRVEVVANQIAVAKNAYVSVQFSRDERQHDAPSRAWFVTSYLANAPVQNVPSGAVKVMSISGGGDGAFLWALMDQSATMRTFPQALTQSVPVDVIGTHFQPSVQNGLLAWLIQL